MSSNYYDKDTDTLIPIAGISKFPAEMGTKAEFEAKKDSLPVGTVFTTTDEFEDKVNEIKIVTINAGELTIPSSRQRYIKLQAPLYDGYTIIGALPISTGIGGVLYGGINIYTDNTVDLWYYNATSEEVNATITVGIIYQKI